MATLHGDSTPLRMSVIRIVDAQQKLRGMGYLVAPDTVITCAHVVAAALKNYTKNQARPPAGTVLINCPLSGLPGDKSQYRQAQVLENGWYPACKPGQEPESGLADIAILRISGEPYATPPPLAPLAPGPQFDHLSFETYGCSKGHEENAVHTKGLTRAPIGNGRIQVEGKSGYRIEPGYSGAPVWSKQARSVIGIIAQDERDKSIPAGFVIPSTLLLAACPLNVREAFYADLRHCRDELVRGIETNASGSVDDIKQFLDIYLGKPDQPVPFGGRGGVLQALDAWLDADEIPYRFLAAPAGRGKSALLAHWVIDLIRHRPKDVAVLFLPISIRFGTNDDTTALRCLAGRLSLFFPNERIGHDSTLFAEDYKNDIHSILNTLSNYPERRFVLVIDGVDEAIPGWFDATLFPYEPPGNLKVLLSARYKPGHSDGKSWLDDLNWECAETSKVLLDLPPLDRAGLSDVLACLGRPLDRLAQRETILEELYRLSEEGDPLLVSLYTKQLLERQDQLDTLTVEEMRQLQPGLKGFFKQWHRDQKTLWQQEGRRYQWSDLENLFTLLATALAPLQFADLHAVAERAGLQRLDDLRDMLAAASRLVIGDGKTQGYTFSHPRLGYYFLDQLDETQRRCYEQAFVDWGATVVTQLNTGELAPEACPEYLLRTYTAHLDSTNSPLENYLALLSEGWQKAWFAWEGAYNGFLSDAERVYQVLRRHNKALWQQNRVSNLLIGQEIRYLLCHVSVCSLSNNLPSELIVQLVEEGLWSKQQALRVVEQLDDGDNKSVALAGLANLLRDSSVLSRQALHLARRITREDIRAKTLLALAPQLTGEECCTVLQEVLAAARQMTYEANRARVLKALAPQLAGKRALLQEVLVAARQMTYEANRARVLKALAPQLAGEPALLQEALATARQMTDGYNRAWVLKALASQLAREEHRIVLQEALAAARQIANVAKRAKALVALAPQLVREEHRIVLQEALAAARQTCDSECARVLKALAPQLAGKPALLREALTATGQMTDGYDGYYRAGVLKALKALAPQLAGEPALLQEALVVARQIAYNGPHRAEALSALVPQLVGEERRNVFQEMLAAARQVVVPSYQGSGAVEHLHAIALDALVPQLAGEERRIVLQEALAATRQIADVAERAEALVALAPQLAGEERRIVFQEALAAAVQIATVRYSSESHQNEVLRALALQLMGEPALLQEALAAARQITNYYRAEVLEALAPKLAGEPALLQGALAVAGQSGDHCCVEVLKALALAPQLAGEERCTVLQEALAVIRQMTGSYDRAKALVALAPQLAGEPVLLQEALAVAREMTGEDDRAEVLVALARQLAGEEHRIVLQEALAAAVQITTVQFFESEYYQNGVLRALALQLMGEPVLFQEALAAARQMTDEGVRAEVLVALAPQLAGEEHRIVLQEALAAAQQMTVDHYRTEVLKALAPQLVGKPALLQEALAAARQMTGEDDRAEVLVALARQLAGEPALFQEALAVARQIANGHYRAKALGALALNPDVSYDLWMDSAEILLTLKRPTLLEVIPSLVPYIKQLGGQQAVKQTAQAIIDVSKWWP